MKSVSLNKSNQEKKGGSLSNYSHNPVHSYFLQLSLLGKKSIKTMIIP